MRVSGLRPMRRADSSRRVWASGRVAFRGSTFTVYYTWAYRFFHSLGKRPDETIVWVRQVEDRKVFADLGVRDVISKPFDPTRIGSQIAAILGWNV